MKALLETVWKGSKLMSYIRLRWVTWNKELCMAFMWTALLWCSIIKSSLLSIMCRVIKIIYFKNRSFFFSPEDWFWRNCGESSTGWKPAQLLVLLKLFLSKKIIFTQKWLQIMQSTSAQQYFSLLVNTTVVYFVSALHKTAGDVYLLFSTG